MGEKMDNNHLQNPYMEQQTNHYMQQPVQVNPYAEQQPMQANPYADPQLTQANPYAGQYTYTESWMNSTGAAGKKATAGYTPYRQAPNYNAGQTFPNQPYAPIPGQTQQSGEQGVAIAGMICGILSMLLCILMIFDLPLALTGLILSISAIAKQDQVNGMAIAGLVCSIIGCLLSTGFFIIVLV